MKIIGRSDIVTFPSLEVNFVSAKIDTGAFTSSIHCERVEEIDGILVVDFGEGNVKEFTDFESIDVTSSNGHTQNRYAIITEVELFGEIMDIKLTLTNRSTMKNECLIGRSFLSHYKILVYVREQNLSIKNIKPFMDGLDDNSLYLEDGNVYNFHNKETLFSAISSILYLGQKKQSDFGKASYSRKMKGKYIMNNGKKITLDKFITFISEDKKNECWYMSGQEHYIKEEIKEN